MTRNVSTPVTATKWLATFAAITGFGLGVPGRSANADLKNSKDFGAVQKVCSQCHSTEVILQQPRSWEQWNVVFAEMVGRGARGTDEELAAITRYVSQNLTTIDVNRSSALEIMLVFQVSETDAASIVNRRSKRPFEDIADLQSVKALDSSIVAALGPRLKY